ncbi:MAG TPA: heme-binding protein [Candidatus Udaeobacter sp.]|nr:heme-binding protein [Candidatus Udaeobacter sp.]
MCPLKTVMQISSILMFALFGTTASAQERPSYGQEITLANAKKVANAALAEAQKNSWNVAIAIVDNHGSLVYYERMDDTQSASPVIAIEKARSAAMFRRSTRAMEDTVNKGRVSFLGIPVATPITGGLPIIVGGKVIGGIGVSGVTSDQDEQVAKAGLEGFK